MSETPTTSPLRRGWTTGACATAALRGALSGLWGGTIPSRVELLLPRGERPVFDITRPSQGPNWAEASVIKDAGDDPDVTHGAEVRVRVEPASEVVFVAGAGVGTVTKPGLPIAVGDPAINPVPRRMMEEIVAELSTIFAQPPGARITISVPGGSQLAAKTWNPRLGIVGGISILGTTGVVRPFSCAAWIASIHRGIDVARADGLTHVAGCTGATSEQVVQALHGLPDHGMLDMGDFAGGLLKYLRRHPIERITIGGGLAKMLKLGQGAVDLHSGRSTTDFSRLSNAMGVDLNACNTVLEAYQRLGAPLASYIAQTARSAAEGLLDDAPVTVETVVIDRAGQIVGRA